MITVKKTLLVVSIKNYFLHIDKKSLYHEIFLERNQQTERFLQLQETKIENTEKYRKRKTELLEKLIDKLPRYDKTTE